MKTRILNFNSIVSITLLLVVASCSNSAVNPITPFKGDVYVAGLVNPTAGPLAAYWKNGVMKQLSDKFSIALAITVADTNVYVAGSTNSLTTGVYWKNSIMTTLPLSDATHAVPYAISVSGTDIFIGGNLLYDSAQMSLTKAAYWKNETLIKLSNSQSSVSGIIVSGSDVYVTGIVAYDSLQTKLYKPVLWKNGVMTKLSVSNGGTSAITLSGSDIYVAGYILVNGHTQAVYWKNGELLKLSMGINTSGIAVAGSDVYVAGASANGSACYWSNGVITLLPPIEPASSFSYSSGIAIHGADVYVSGNLIDNSGKNATVVYWKNGVVSTMPNAVSNYAISYTMAIQ